MKKYILILLTILMLTPTANAQHKKEVVIFSQPCYYCELMKKDLNEKIIPANPDIKFTILDIQEEQNHKLLLKYVAEHKIRGNNIGLPLLFIGSNHIMGWGDNANEQIQEYIEEFKQEKISRVPFNMH